MARHDGLLRGSPTNRQNQHLGKIVATPVIPATEISIGARSGYLEVFEMGEDFDDLEVDFTDCQELAERWNNGDWSSESTSGLISTSGETYVTTTLIHVERGTSYNIPPTSLDEFSNIVQHEPPASGKPDLTSAHDEGTASGATRPDSATRIAALKMTGTIPWMP